MKDDGIGSLVVCFGMMSLLAIGGVTSVITEMQRQTVDVHGWVGAREFAEMFALAQVAPGPNTMVVVLIGYVVAGPLGAAASVAAMCVPSGVLAFFVSRAWQRFHHAPWRILLQAALVPISTGLIAASALVLARASDHSIQAVALTIVTAAATYATRINPLWLFALAGLIGYAGLV
jgi:chromate transporter